MSPKPPPSSTEWLPVVSVVVATHNRPQLLRAALAAILGQDYTGDIECVIVFDRAEPERDLEGFGGSSPSRSVRVIVNHRSPGLAGARNSGIMASTGELVAFCDDDDEWEQDKVRLQVASLADPGTLTAVTGIRIVYADHVSARVPSPTSVTVSQLARNRVMEAHPSTVMVRRDALLGPIGLVDEAIPGSYGEDFDWILRAAKAGTIAVVERDLVTVRWGQSLFSRNWQVMIDAIDYMLAKHPELRDDRQGHARLLGRRAFAQAALHRTRSAMRDAFAAVKLSWRERRAYVAIIVAMRLVSAERLLAFAHRRGHGI
jgi:glycosyltransferase involved in cell wall biosynthesis